MIRKLQRRSLLARNVSILYDDGIANIMYEYCILIHYVITNQYLLYLCLSLGI